MFFSWARRTMPFCMTKIITASSLPTPFSQHSSFLLNTSSGQIPFFTSPWHTHCLGTINPFGSCRVRERRFCSGISRMSGRVIEQLQDPEPISYLSQKDAAEIDEILMGPLGFSVDQLMELAGLSVATSIAEEAQVMHEYMEMAYHNMPTPPTSL